MSVPMKFREIGDFHEYYGSQRTAPYLTIFVGGNHEASNYLFELFYGGWVAPNIYYLGAANIVRCGPLRIAGLSGIWKGYNYRKLHHERLPYSDDDVKSIYHVREIDVRKLLQVRTQVDIGISHDWPKGVEWMGDWKSLFAKKNLFEADARTGKLGSAAAKYVLDRLRPPFWFSAHLHCKFSALVRHSGEQDQHGSSQDQSRHETSIARSSQAIEVDSRAEQMTTGKETSANAEEIDIDMEDLGQSPRSPKSPASVSMPIVTNANDSVSAELREQLPDAFKRPNRSLETAKPDFPSQITNETTQFLALDKCLPGRKCIQLLEIEPIAERLKDSAPPFSLSYDKEWLAITRAFANELVVGDAASRPKPDMGESHYKSLIEVEEDWVARNLVSKDKMEIPTKFELTAPTFDPSIGINTRMQPEEYTNPQTSAFCGMLEIANPFDIPEAERQQRREKGPTMNAPQHSRRGNSFGNGRHAGRGRGRGNHGIGPHRSRGHA